MSLVAEAAHRIAARVRAREVSAEDVVRDALSRIRVRNAQLHCFTSVLEARAIDDATRLDRLIAAGHDPGPLTGVPFGVQDLFDVAGVVTLAGSKMLAANAPAHQDAPLVRRLRQAGAVLVGCQNMDEFSHGVTTGNAHYGTTRNPHDLERTAGGSSGGAAASVAAGLTPLALGMDTNGTIRVPASFCGVFGLKPTFGRLPRNGSFPCDHDLDHPGPFARCATDLALAYDLLQGYDPGDAACVMRPFESASSVLDRGIAELRAGVLGEWFAEGASDAALDAVERVAAAFTAVARLTLPEARRAHAAPELFERVDILLAPATPTVAPLSGAETMRADIGIHTQPISCIGLPVVAMPLWTKQGLPIGVQVIAPAWHEARALRVAAHLERAGVVSATRPA